MGENLQGIFWNFEVHMWFLYYDLLSYEFSFLFIKLPFFFKLFFSICFAIQCFECWNMSVLIFIAAVEQTGYSASGQGHLTSMEFCHGHCKLYQLPKFLFWAQSCVYFVLWYKQRVYLNVYNCSLQFSFSHMMKHFKEYAWNFIYLAKRSVCCFYLWNQVFIRFLYESH